MVLCKYTESKIIKANLKEKEEEDEKEMKEKKKQ